MGSGGQSHPRERRQLSAAPSRAADGAGSWPALVLPSRCQPDPWQPLPVAEGHRWRGDSRGQVAGSFGPWLQLAPGAHTALQLEGTALPGLLKSPGHDFQHGTWPNSTPLAMEPAQPAHPIPGELCTSTHTAPGAPSCPQITRWAAGQEQSLACAAPWGAVPHPQGPGSAPQVVGHPHHQREPRGVRTLCPCVCTARTPRGGYTNIHLSPQARITASILL